MIKKLFSLVLPLWAFSLSFGGKGGSSSTSSSTSTSSTTNNTDRRIVADNGATVVGDGSTVTVTDLDSVRMAAEVAEASVLGSTKVATEASALTGTIAKQAIDQIGAAYKEANKQAQDAFSGNKTLITVGVIGAALLGLTVLTKKKA